MEQRAVGEGGQGRQECRPHNGGVSHKGSVNSGGERNSSEADHRHDCRCGTQDCVLHEGRRLEVERAVVRAGWRGDSRAARDCVALPA